MSRHNLRLGACFIAAALCFPVLSFSQKVTVSGTVISGSDNLPVSGAGVLLSSGGGTVTDSDGKYSVDADADAAIEFSCLGYKTVIENISGRKIINVVLYEDAKYLDEVVVLGYTSQKKTELTSSVVSMQAEKLTDVTTADIGNMLQGKAAGVLVTNSSGQPGSSATIRIRGTGSITAGADPLYVVDGVAGGTFNPNDIETLTILKDASATALYGAAAAGGVIVITTKSGKSDKVEVDFKAQAGIKKALTGRFSPMGSEELYYTQKLLYSSNLFSIQRPKTLLDTDFDWMDAAFRTGVVQNWYVSASGKSGKTSLFASIDHYDEQGSLINTSYMRNSARVNLTTEMAKGLTLAIRLGYNRSNDQQTSSYVTLEQAYRALPWDYPYDVTTGEILYVDSAVRSDNGGTWYSHDKYNFLHNEEYNYNKSENEEITADVQLCWSITGWLTFTTTNRFSSSNYFNEQYIDPRTKSPSYGNAGYIYNASARSAGIGTTNLLKAFKTFGDHSVNGVIGFEGGKGKYREHYADGNNMPKGQASLTSAIVEDAGGYASRSASWSAVAQAQYSYKEKYILTGSVRYDATYKFAPSNRGGVFPGVSAGWIASNEDFLKDNKVLSFFKVRCGYGLTGNDNITAFLYQDAYSLSTSYAGTVGAVADRQANPKLGWEKAAMASFGLDFGLLKHVDLSVDLYNTRNSSLLLDVPQAPSTGFLVHTENIGVINNSGVEVAVDADIISKRDWKWNVGFNAGMNRNRVTDLPVDEMQQSMPSSSLKQIIREGEDIYSWYMPKWAGVDPANGDPLWEKVADDGTVTTTNSYTDATWQIVGSASPKLSGGISTSVNWKGLSLAASGGFVIGNKIFNYARVSMDSDGASTDYNMVSFDNGLGWSRWEKEGDIATHPKAVLGGNKSAHSISSRYLENGSYFRLRNITVSYDVGRHFNKVIRGMRVYVSADNIATVTKFSGMDPEVLIEKTSWSLAGTYSMNYPVPMSIVGGVEIKF